MVIGQYKIIEKIGEGGMGIVYKAEHTTLEQIVALKALPVTLSSNKEMRERFIREAKIQAKLSHQNVVNLHNFFEYDNNFYLVMEYVEGETVESILKKSGLIPPDRCISLFKQILEGIGYAHSKGIIHRDIKPSNIMINKDGIIKITDFGIAKLAGDFNRTQTGVKIGTLCYMSPEQVRGQSVGIATDIYSLGITLFEMVTGNLPFSGNSEYQIMRSIVDIKPPSPKEFYPYIPLKIEKAILKAISKQPSDRFKSTKEFLDALINNDFSYKEYIAQPYIVKSQILKSDRFLNTFSKIKILNKRILWSLLIVLMLISIALIYLGISGGKIGKTLESHQHLSSQPQPANYLPSSLNDAENDTSYKNIDNSFSPKTDKKKITLDQKDNINNTAIQKDTDLNSNTKINAGSWGRKRLKE